METRLLCSSGCVNDGDVLPLGATACEVCPVCGHLVTEFDELQCFKGRPQLGMAHMHQNKGKLYKEIGTNCVYMLAQVGYKKYNMINVDTGNRMHGDPSSFAHEVLCGFEKLEGWKLELHQEVEDL